MHKNGVLLVNLGTPDSYEPKAVGRYLRQFLMDPDVIDIPFPIRWMLVNYIVPRRSRDSGLLYQKIWTDRGSPLLFHSQDLAQKVSEALKDTHIVRLGMRYGNPSIASALAELQKEGCDKLTVMPLYPQYSLAATQSSVAEVQRAMKKLGLNWEVKWVPEFYRSEAYLDAVAEVSLPYLRKWPYDLALFSFHGLPERHMKKMDRSNAWCLSHAACSEKPNEWNRHCYRHQSYVTADELAKRLGINPLRYTVGFQSRLGRTPWIKPHSDEFYRTLPSKGIKRLIVLSPSFVADCLETLEEIQIRGLEEFRRSGGEALQLVPSLNSHPAWVKAVCTLLDQTADHAPPGH